MFWRTTIYRPHGDLFREAWTFSEETDHHLSLIKYVVETRESKRHKFRRARIWEWAAFHGDGRATKPKEPPSDVIEEAVSLLRATIDYVGVPEREK